MSKRIVTVEVTRYYSKTASVDIFVDNDLLDEALVEFLTNDDDLNEDMENSIFSASLNGDDTTYEWQDPTNSTGGTL